jgi:hypothetical protein
MSSSTRSLPSVFAEPPSISMARCCAPDSKSPGRGYNPHHPKDPSYYPLLAHLAQTGQILRVKMA